ncbi:hypothetical protein [Calothrix sp. NIES-2098]|uniref:hypothetical protein n=1 Tax=Calothrix sp. NIES-2098 TaxID=1954171 RepID=UPI000B61BBC1|nr:hypothetical protein NIES2098_29400 [Calothrix sp. NIES-2098]
MNIKHFPYHLSLSFTFALALIICQTSQPASAQTNNFSDSTSNILTTGDITGGTFYQYPSTNSGEPITGVVFKSSSVQAAVNNAAVDIVGKLSINGLTSPTGQPIPSETQQNLRSVLTGSECVPSTNGNLTQSTAPGNSENTNACTGQITAALSSVQGNAGLERVQQLAKKLQGLLKTNSSKQTELANGRVNAIRLIDVVNAYNDLIDNSSAEFLNNPPPELQAIQAVLLQLVSSVSAANR